MKTSIIAPRAQPALAAIRLGMSDRADAETRYGTMLMWFMRFLALVWMAQGLANWGLMLADDGDSQGLLDRLSEVGAAAIIFFAVLDLIAAIGLWLSASWGGVIWLVTVAAQWLALVLLPGFFPYDLTTGLIDIGLVAIYFFLTFRAAREIDQ